MSFPLRFFPFGSSVTWLKSKICILCVPVVCKTWFWADREAWPDSYLTLVHWYQAPKGPHAVSTAPLTSYLCQDTLCLLPHIQILVQIPPLPSRTSSSLTPLSPHPTADKFYLSLSPHCLLFRAPLGTFPCLNHNSISRPCLPDRIGTPES